MSRHLPLGEDRDPAPAGDKQLEGWASAVWWVTSVVVILCAALAWPDELMRMWKG